MGENINAANIFLIRLICVGEKYLVCDLQIEQAKVHKKEAVIAENTPNISI